MTAPRNEVLSQEEQDHVAQLRAWAERDAYDPSKPVTHTLALIKRLVSRIESDAAKSAALRKVVEAARAVGAWPLDDLEAPECGEVLSLKAALADLDRLTKAATDG